MKRTSTPQQWLTAAAAGLALAFSAGTSSAATDQTLGTFDSDLTGYFSWGRGWGGLTEVVWDANGNPGGCLVAKGLLESTNSDTPVCIYAVNAGNPWDHQKPPFDLSQYKAIEFDIKWNNDPTNMPLNQFNYPSGDPEVWSTTGLEIGSLPSVSGDNSGYVTITNMPIPSAAAGGWVHVVIPIDPTKPGLETSYGLWIRKWICNPPANPGDWQTGHVVTNTGNYEFYLDNVVLKGGEALPAPTIAPLETPTPGMAFVAATGGEWDRQNIRTVGTNYSWIGRPGPVSYSVDIAKHAPVDGFRLHMFLVPGISSPTRGDSDYYEPNCMMVQINGNPSGGCWAQVNCKTNAPDSNGRQFEDIATGGGNLGGAAGGFWANNGVGTWTLTIEQNTNVVLKAPDGSGLTNAIPAAIMDVWKAYPQMQFAVGIMPGNPARVGYKATVSGVRITGTAEPDLNANFVTSPLDTNLWTIVAQSPTYGVQHVSTNAAYWLKWSLPANGFSLQCKATLDPGSWITSAVGGYDVAGMHTVLLNKSDLPSANSGYFRLYKQVATKLQILLPGEVSAPGTPTGKTGTSIQPQNSIPYTFTVNAVDDNWNIVTKITDTVGITSSEAIALLPPDAALVNGTANFDITLFEAGTWTITATDVSDPAKAPATVSVTVP